VKVTAIDVSELAVTKLQLAEMLLDIDQPLGLNLVAKSNAVRVADRSSDLD
jgi:hypothetical protein